MEQPVSSGYDPPVKQKLTRLAGRTKTLFARSNPIVLTSPMDASRKWFATPPLWHIEAVGGVHIIKAA
jgi:hypothetical protein